MSERGKCSECIHFTPTTSPRSRIIERALQELEKSRGNPPPQLGTCALHTGTAVSDEKCKNPLSFDESGEPTSFGFQPITPPTTPDH